MERLLTNNFYFRKCVDYLIHSRITSQIEKDYNVYKQQKKNTHHELDVLDDYIIEKVVLDDALSDFEYSDYLQYKYDKFTNISLTDERIYEVVRDIDFGFINKKDLYKKPFVKLLGKLHFKPI